MKSRRTLSITPLMLLAIAGATPSYGQQRALNPTVAVREHPSSTVPTECEQGLEPAVPRASQPLPAPLPETSSQIANQDVAQALRRVQAASEADDRDSFVAALAEAVAAAEAAPPGGQRDAAREALRVDSDIDRLWSFSVASPTGAFFDANSEGGALLTMLRQYRDFGRSILDSTLVVDGQTLYPTRESRRFLVQEAASRLLRLGIHSAARAPRPPATMRTRPSQIETADAAPSQPTAVAPSLRDHHVPAATGAGSREDTSSRSRGVAVHAAGPSAKPSATSTKNSGTATTPKHARTAPVKRAAATSGSGNTSGKSSTPQPQPSVPRHVAAMPAPAHPAPHAESNLEKKSPSSASPTPPAGSPPSTTRASAVSSTTGSGRAPVVTSSSNVVSSAAGSSTNSTQSAMQPDASSVSRSASPIASTATTTSTATSSTTFTAMDGTATGRTTDSAGSASMPAPTETATSTTTAAGTAAGGGRLNLLFAIILIVAGIGLLVVFLRASD